MEIQIVDASSYQHRCLSTKCRGELQNIFRNIYPNFTYMFNNVKLFIQSSTLSNQQYKHNENVFLSVLGIPSKFWVNAIPFKYIKMQSDEFYSSNIWIISSNKGI